jgi:hypothetical protein
MTSGQFAGWKIVLTGMRARELNFAESFQTLINISFPKIVGERGMGE